MYTPKQEDKKVEMTTYNKQLTKKEAVSRSG